MTSTDLRQSSDNARREARRLERAYRQEKLAEEMQKLHSDGQGTPRKAMTPARRLRVLAKSGGHCAYPDCTVTEGLQIDHIIALQLMGKETDENLTALCVEHHKAKTKLDVKLIAKAKRLALKHTGNETKAKRAWPSRPMQSRGFR